MNWWKHIYNFQTLALPFIWFAFSCDSIESSRDDQLNALSNDFHFVIADVNSDGEPTFDRWAPAANQIKKAAANFYVNAATKNLLNNHLDTLQKCKVGGLGRNIERNENASESSKPRTDYLTPPTAVNYTESGVFTESDLLARPIEITPELIFVVDYELSQVFEGNYQRILEYYIPFMWDINNRYKTLPSTRISIQLNGIVVMASPAAQPFIEESRAEDGRVENGRMLGRFGTWVAQNLKKLPPLDYASLATNARAEWGGGLAWVGPGCHGDGDYHYGTHVYQESGNWGAIGIMAHELGHNLGAGHDGGTECEGLGNIMGGQNSRFYFSRCSDAQIGNYARNDRTACLRDPPSNNPATDPEFVYPQAPSALDQCRRRVRNPDAWATNENCFTATCNWKDDPSNNWWWVSGFDVLDNSPCEENGRCFRGKCRQPFVLMQNVASGLCMEAENNFASNDPQSLVKMVNCPRTGTPVNGFVLTPALKGFFMETPYIDGNQETAEKCIYIRDGENERLRMWACGDPKNSGDNGWYGWELVPVVNGQFLLQHISTRRCAMTLSTSVGSSVVVSGKCDRSNPSFRWRKN